MVRTPASHAGNPGSNPGGITIEESEPLDRGSFLFWDDQDVPLFKRDNPGSNPGGITKNQTGISNLANPCLVFRIGFRIDGPFHIIYSFNK